MSKTAAGETEVPPAFFVTTSKTDISDKNKKSEPIADWH